MIYEIFNRLICVDVEWNGEGSAACENVICSIRRSIQASPDNRKRRSSTDDKFNALINNSSHDKSKLTRKL